jgi:hypothetical protein
MQETDTPIQAAIDRAAQLYSDQNYLSCIEQCCATARMGLLPEPVMTTIVTLIGNCAVKLSPGDSAASNRDPCCSFCSKFPPAVRLGAGPSVFICNECVRLFDHTLNA